MKKIFWIFLAIFCLSTSAHAHHSDVGIELDKTIVLEVTVTDFVWRNPHVYLRVDATSSSDQNVGEWEFQMAATAILGRGGWTKDTLKPGDELVIRSHPAANGRRYGLIESIEKDGEIMNRRAGNAVESAAAESLEGVWRGDRSTIGGFTEFFDRLVPNEKGRLANESFDHLSDDNPMVSCTGRPSPSTLASAGLYLNEMEFDGDTIIHRTEIFDSYKVIHMDGRGHPENGERTLHGHSIGKWEGDTLVVDTINFADHRSPYQNGIPSGAQKHMIEKYTLINDGRRMRVEMFLEDPEYLAEPLTHTMEWVYSPDSQMIPWECNEEASKTFLPD